MVLQWCTTSTVRRSRCDHLLFPSTGSRHHQYPPLLRSHTFARAPETGYKTLSIPYPFLYFKRILHLHTGYFYFHITPLSLYPFTHSFPFTFTTTTMPRGSYVPFKLPKVAGWVQKPQDPASIVTHIATGTKIKADLFRTWVHDPAYPNVPLPKWHPDVVAARQRRQRQRQAAAGPLYAPGAYNGSGFGPLNPAPAAMQQRQVGLGLHARPTAIGAPEAYNLPLASPFRPLPTGMASTPTPAAMQVSLCEQRTRPSGIGALGAYDAALPFGLPVYMATTPAVPATMQVRLGGQRAHPQYAPGAYNTSPGSLPMGKPVPRPVPAPRAPYPSPTSIESTPTRSRQDTTSTSPEPAPVDFLEFDIKSADILDTTFPESGVDTVVSRTMDVDTNSFGKDIAFLESWLQTENDQPGPSALFFPMS